MDSNETNATMSRAMQHLDFFFVYLSPFVYSAAIIGNTFLLYVLIRKRKRTKLPPTINTAICCLLVSDLVACWLWFAVDISDRILGESLLQWNKTICLTFVYTLVTFCNLQGYIQCIISFERFMAVLIPLRVRRIVTLRRMAVALAISLVLVGLLHVVYIVYGYSFTDGRCQMKDKLIMGVFNAVIYCGIPSVIQIVCTVGIIVSLFKRHYKKTITSTSNNLPSTEIRLAITLVIMDVMYVITTLPITLLFFFLPHHFKSSKSRQNWAYHGDLAWLLTMVGATTDWIIFLILGRQIRIVIGRMLGCRQTVTSSQGESSHVYMKIMRKNNDY